jgi:hypothetical protein
MSEYLIAFIVVLIFLAVIFVVWRGGKLSVKYKDIGVDAEGSDQSKPVEQLPQEPESSGPTMSMTASGQGSAITDSTQSISGATTGSPKLDMAAKDGGKIKGAGQHLSNEDQEP